MSESTSVSKFASTRAFFTTQGRANRKTFWITAAWIIVAFAIAITLATLFGDNGVYDDTVLARPFRLAIVIVAFIPVLVLAFRFRGICIRRRRDCRMSDRLHRLRWIPYIGRYAHLGALGFLPSRDDPLEVASRVFDGPADQVTTSTAASPKPVSSHERREPTF